MVKKPHICLALILILTLWFIHGCETNNRLVDPFPTAKVQIELVFPGQEQSTVHNTALTKGAGIQAFDDVKVSVLDSATQEVIVKQQALEISNNVARGELNIPVRGDQQTFTIIVFASNAQQLQFLVGSNNVMLEAGEVHTEPLFIILDLPNLIAPPGAVRASTTLPDGSASPNQAIDFDFATSWFSDGAAESGNTSTFTWTSPQSDFIASVGIVNNAEHTVPAFRTGHGWQKVTVQVFTGPVATGEMVFEETVDYPGTGGLPVAVVTPLTSARSVHLIFDGPESPDFNGFSELLIVGDPTKDFVIPELQSISVTPLNASVEVGQTQQFTATGTFSDGSSRNLTNQVTWTSSNTSVAAISTSGLATAQQAGNTTIRASQNGVTGQATLTVTSASLISLDIAPQNPSIQVGQTQQFTATGTFSDGSTADLTSSVSWGSSNASVASIDANGLATGLQAGTSTISASQNGITANTLLTVNPASLISLDIAPQNPSIDVGQTQQFTATGTFSDGSTADLTSSVSWGSSNASVATIDANGLATGLQAGTSTISASQDGVTANTLLTVNAVTSGGATLRNLQATVVQLNDSTSCVFSNGSVGSLFQLDFDFSNGNGNVTTGTTVDISFDFQPSGSVGSFTVSSPDIQGDGTQGSISFLVCFLFSADTTVTLTVKITDSVGQESNGVTIEVSRPNGANVPRKLSNTIQTSTVGVCTKPRF